MGRGRREAIYFILYNTNRLRCKYFWRYGQFSLLITSLEKGLDLPIDFNKKHRLAYYLIIHYPSCPLLKSSSFCSSLLNIWISQCFIFKSSRCTRGLIALYVFPINSTATHVQLRNTYRAPSSARYVLEFESTISILILDGSFLTINIPDV